MNPFNQKTLKDTNSVSAQRGLRTVESASPAESGASANQTTNMLPKLYDAQEVIAEERIELQLLRASREQQPPKELANGVFDTVGVCLSGGGIRSGAFCLGAMQALENNGILHETDYLSTVSGGGYTGISAALSMSETGEFPFFKVDESSDTPGVSLLRQNAKYLRSNHLMEMAKNVAVVLRGVAANIIIVLAALLLLAGISLAINPTYDDLGVSWLSSIGPFKGLASISFGVLMLCAAFIIFVLWALMTMVHKTAGAQGPDAKTASYVLVFVLLVAFFEIQPVLVQKMIGEKANTIVSKCVASELFAECKKATDGSIPDACDLGGMNYSCKPPSKSGKVNSFNANFGDGTGNLVAGLVGVFTAVSGFLTLLASSLGRFLRTDSNQSGFYGQVIGFLQSKLIWLVAGAIFPLTVWLVYLLIFYWGVLATKPASTVVPTFAALIRNISTEGFLGINQPYAVVFCVGMVLFAISMFFSANGNSPHRLYRDRLGDAFCFTMIPAVAGGEAKHKPLLDKKISELGHLGPYLIVNAALNVAGDPAVNKGGRNADFFMFSKLFTGSATTKYAKTSLVEELQGGEILDAATAMAVSGAAFSSNMGSSTIRFLRPTLAFFNVRLGCWFPNPSNVLGARLAPMFWYFYNEVIGNMSASRSIVYLTDGGHIDNLGLYELLRRRCQIIIVVDSEADPEMTFPSFVAAQRHARIDLGVRIKLPWKRLAATSIAAQKANGTASRGPHCAIGRIDYEGKGQGVLIYIKSSVTGDENDYIRDYNRRHKDYPHQTTGDQFFSEEQFEVYRALGFHAADRLFTGQDKVETLTADLAYVNDKKSKDECVLEVIARLKLKAKTYKQSRDKPTVHMIKLVGAKK